MRLTLRQLKKIIAENVQGCKQPHYFGSAGAGFIFLCKDDQTIYLQKRNTRGGIGQWGFPGGGFSPKILGFIPYERFFDTPIDEKHRFKPDDPAFMKNAQREVVEETGSMPEHQLIDTHIYEDCGFIYKTFIANMTAKEKSNWEPRIDSENLDHGWYPISEFLKMDLFFGFTQPLISRVLKNVKAKH